MQPLSRTLLWEAAERLCSTWLQPPLCTQQAAQLIRIAVSLPSLSSLLTTVLAVMGRKEDSDLGIPALPQASSLALLQSPGSRSPPVKEEISFPPAQRQPGQHTLLSLNLARFQDTRLS